MSRHGIKLINTSYFRKFVEYFVVYVIFQMVQLLLDSRTQYYIFIMFKHVDKVIFLILRTISVNNKIFERLKYPVNKFSQTSLKRQGLLLLEQGIARVCSIGEQVDRKSVV